MQAPSYSYFRRLETTKKGFPGKYLYDPDHYERELEVFYYNMWVAVGRTDEVPNPRDYKTFTVGRQNVMVVRDLKGELGAFHNTCRHRGSNPLHGGDRVIPGRVHRLSVPRPGRTAWDGRPNSYSAPTGVGRLRHDGLLALQRGCGHVGRVSLPEPGGRQSASRFRACWATCLPGSRTTTWKTCGSASEIVLDVKANWKLLFENFAGVLPLPYGAPGVLQHRGLGLGRRPVGHQRGRVSATRSRR